MKTLLSLFLLVNLTSCGMPEDSQSSPKQNLERAPQIDSTLMKTHEFLGYGRDLQNCSIKSSRAWNGIYHSLWVEFTSGEDKTRLEFKTSGHITSRVKVKNYLFSKKVKSITLEKIDFHKVPLSRKDEVTVLFDKNGEVSEITHEVFIGSQWNDVDKTSCKRS